MTEIIYTAVTFAPVQGFIQKSRKLRDLYGSSFILSYLAKAICEAARKHFGVSKDNPPSDVDPVVSPAIINVTQGTPNQIVIRGDFPSKKAEEAFNNAWYKVINECRLWIETSCQELIEQDRQKWAQNNEWCINALELPWTRNWQNWSNHAWEFFWEQGDSISAARETLKEQKRWRNWIGINWTGESSTLSGADAVAYPGMSRLNPKKWDYQTDKNAIESFYKLLSGKVGAAFLQYIEDQLKQQTTSKLPKELVERYGKGFLKFIQEKLPKLSRKERKELEIEYGSAIINSDEELSIPELVKRLVTLEAIAQPIGIPFKEVPSTYRELNRLSQKKKEKNQEKQQKKPARESDNRWTGWFQGDGDKVGKFLQKLKDDSSNEEADLRKFSNAMLKWGENTLKPSLPSGKGRVIYAGGDDFLGVFYRASPNPRFLTPLLNYLVKEQINKHPEQTHQLQKIQQQISQKGLHKNISIPESIRLYWKKIINEKGQSPELKEQIEYAGLSQEEAAILFAQPVLQPQECLDWFYKFRSDGSADDLWSQHQHQNDITVSVGFVWAAPGVPQRDVLQHCQQAEKSAKSNGRDRIAIRILYNSGTHIEWVCPWWWLETLFTSYRDKDGKTTDANWTHFYNDVVVLESRHAFDNNKDIALALFEVYFAKENRDKLANQDFWWNDNNAKDTEKKTGILGEQENYQKNNQLDKKAINQTISDWVINLAKVGFHLHSNSS